MVVVVVVTFSHRYTVAWCAVTGRSPKTVAWKHASQDIRWVVTAQG